MHKGMERMTVCGRACDGPFYHATALKKKEKTSR